MQRVWDPLVRALHWLLAAAVLTSWISGQWPEAVGGRFDRIHHGAGYVALAAVTIRLLWGFVGRGHARFARFVRGPRATWTYARRLCAAREPRHLGHNPLGGWMVLGLLTSSAAASVTGMLYIGDWLWGYQWLADLHAALAWLIMALVLAHWMGVAFTSWRHRENLVGAMISGDKRAARRDDIA
ncbi:cytochrome b/b6 domain-containing protein [Roseateles violae]|uniref:Cytochrome b/b6 domain-containing protein n=1 Tax=Roseateles violae TaxID=3058042 RepID=A0ABT8DS02_9BURK|nr:cytochrome b/b6 domain-containing protein [Pelomonas sp. PFR6]MDN3918916.1 cytochrome b/b6 domain-containing protein [Pelomonas sp. PFR6]